MKWKYSADLIKTKQTFELFPTFPLQQTHIKPKKKKTIWFQFASAEEFEYIWMESQVREWKTPEKGKKKLWKATPKALQHIFFSCACVKLRKILQIIHSHVRQIEVCFELKLKFEREKESADPKRLIVGFVCFKENLGSGEFRREIVRNYSFDVFKAERIKWNWGREAEGEPFNLRKF